MSYTFIKEVNYSDYKPQAILAISQEIETLNLADTYDGFGQLVGHYNAGDYSLYNSDSSAQQDCIAAIEQKFNIDNVQIRHDDDFVMSSFNRIDCDYYDNFRVEDDHYVLTEEDKEYNKILQLIIDTNEFIINWEKENSNYSTCKGFDYWNGNNWKTVITSIDQYEPSHTVIQVDGLNDEIETAVHLESKGALHLHESENYWLVECQYATAFEKYSIYLKSEVDKDDIF